MTCGIYAIVNSTNDKVYIGQAQDIEKRWKHHKWGLENKKHNNKHLENSYYKYGKENFNFIILHKCNEDDLNYYEMKYILIYETTNTKKGYNKTYGGDSEKPTDETRKKLSETHKGEKNYNYGKHLSEKTRKKMSEWHKGKVLSDETRKKIGEWQKGKVLSDETRKKISESEKGKIVSDETRKKMSETHKGEKHINAKKLYVYNILNNEVKIYNCKTYLAQEFCKKGYIKTISTGNNHLSINYKYTNVNTKIPFHEYVIFSTEELLNDYLKENNLIKELKVNG